MKRLLISLLLVSVSACRSVSGDSTSKIIGGEDFDGLPEVGVILRAGKMHCTASLISEKRIVTAAHCLDPRTITLTTLQFATGAQIEGARIYELASTAIHPDYNPVTKTNDIAYADLKEAPGLPPVTLYEGSYETLVGKSLLLVGYGNSSQKERKSGRKRKVLMKVQGINAGKIRFQEDGKSACDGDSGGPAFVQDAEGRMQLAGVTSCGASQCDSYGVYTRLDPYRGFLGLSAAADPKVEVPVCGIYSSSERCDGDETVTCRNDCFEAQFTRINCAGPNGGRCVSDSVTQRCIDASFSRRTLQFRKLSYSAAGGFTESLYNGLGVFVEGGSGLGTKIYATANSQGEITDYFQDAPHQLRLRRGDRSYSPFSRMEISPGPKLQPLLFGDSAVQITAKYRPLAGQALYVTGPGPLFDEGRIAFRMKEQSEGVWIFEDALPKSMPFELILADSEEARIETASGLRQTADSNQKIPSGTPAYNEWSKVEITPHFPGSATR